MFVNMDNKPTWMEEQVKCLGDRLGKPKAGTPSASQIPMSSQLPPIRSGTWMSSDHSARNPWTFLDPAIKQMSPYQMGRRSKYFHAGFRHRSGSASVAPSPLPEILIKPLSTTRANTPVKDYRKVKKVTIVDEPYDITLEAPPQPEITQVPREITPAQEFRSAPPEVLRNAAELHEAESKSEDVVHVKCSEINLPEFVDIPAVVSPMKVLENPRFKETVTDLSESSDQDTAKEIEVFKNPKSPVVTESVDKFKRQEEILFQGMNNALVVQKIQPAPQHSETERVVEEQAAEDTVQNAGVEAQTPDVELGEKSVNTEPHEKNVEVKPATKTGKDVQCGGQKEFNQNEEHEEDEEGGDEEEKYRKQAEAHIRELDQFACILRGDETFDSVYQSSRVVRIFLSSTFSDTKGERNYLARLAYPRLQEWCQTLGLEFQVVDMRWGVTQDAVLDHATTDICLQQIAECQRLSRGANFVAFLGSRYGYQAPPTTVDQKEMDTLQDIAKTKSVPNGKLLSTWYKLDENAMPPQYVLLKITTVMKDVDIKSQETETRKRALNKWGVICSQLLRCLRETTQIAIAEGKFPPESLYKHQKSVTELEIDKGIFSCEKPKALFFTRTLDGLQQSLADPIAHKFIDLNIDKDGKRHVNRFSENRLAEIRKNIQEKLSPENIHSYNLAWASLGLNVQEYQEVDQYLTQFCDDFVNSIKAMTLRALEDGKLPPLVEEIAFHTHFTGKRCSTFCGRKDVLQTIKSNLCHLDKQSSPIVVYGRSGCGKTSILSIVARCAREWLQKNVVVVLRFLGTTPMSTKVLPMLQSVCTQLSSVYDLPSKEHFEIPMDLFQHFQEMLDKISQSKGKEQPLLLLFDSLDQLSSVDGAHYLTWLPKSLPPFVKLVTSTLEFDFSILQTLKRSMPPDATYIKVENLTDTTIEEFVEVYLERNGRTLTEKQKSEFNQVFSENTHPIYIRLLMDQARQMRSFDSIDATLLPLTAEMAMAALFDSLENRFGRVFVSHAFTFLTICDGGMSEREIDDALSLDDLVLNEVYEFHDPPIQGSIRVPPLLWVRLAFEVDQYLTEHDVDDVTTVTWYHMLFQKFAYSRYSNKDKYGATKEHCFECLKELFTHEGKVLKTIVLSKRNKVISDADRGAVHYPLVPSGKRKLMLLPYLLYNCKNTDMTKDIFCNFDWLLTKLKGASYSQLKHDFSYTNSKNLEARIVMDTLNMGSSVFQENPDLLAFELVSRLPHDPLPDMPNISQLVQQCLCFMRCLTTTQMIPTSPCLPAPSGLLKTTIHGPTDLLDVYGDCFALTRGTVAGFQVWNIDSLELQHYLCDGYKVESNITYQDEESKLAVQTYQTTLNVWDVETGAIVKSMNVFPDSKDTPDTPLKWAIEVFCISKSKHLCIIKVIVPFLFKDNKRLVLCDLDNSNVKPIGLGTKKRAIQVARREIITGAQFINNDAEILVWCNTTPPCIVFVDATTLQTVDIINVIDTSRKLALKLHHNNYYFHPTKPHFLLACRTFNFAVVDLELRCLRNSLSDTYMNGKIADVCWKADGIVLATFSPKNKLARLVMYDSKYQKLKEHLLRKGHPRVLRLVPKSDIVAIGYTYIGAIDFWKLDTMTCIFTLKGHSASINTIIFSEDSRNMFTSSENKAVKVWSIGSALEAYLPERAGSESEEEFCIKPNSQLSLFRKLHQQETFVTNVEQILQLKGGKQFISTYANKSPVLWNLERPGENQQLQPSPNTDGTLMAVESPEGFFIYGLSQRKGNEEKDSFVNVVDKWNVTSCKLLATSEEITTTEENMCGISVFPKTGGVAVLKRMETETELHVLEHSRLQVIRIHRIQRSVEENSVLISADESVVVSVNTRNSIVVWLLADRNEDTAAEDSPMVTQNDVTTEMSSPKIVNTPVLNLPLRAQPTGVVLADDHNMIAGLHQGPIEITTLTKDTDLGLGNHERLTTADDKHTGEVWGVRLFPDNRHLLTVSNDKSYKIIDRIDRRVVYTKEDAHHGRIRCCDVSTDGRLAVTGGRDKAIRLWAVKEGRPLCSVNMYEDVYEIMFSLSGRMVVALIHKFGERRLAIFNICGNLDNV